MTEEEKLEKYKEISKRIADGKITKEEAISEYMKLDYSREDAQMIYQHVKDKA